MKKINLEHLSSAKSEAKRIINPVLTGPQVAWACRWEKGIPPYSKLKDKSLQEKRTNLGQIPRIWRDSSSDDDLSSFFFPPTTLYSNRSTSMSCFPIGPAASRKQVVVDQSPLRVLLISKSISKNTPTGDFRTAASSEGSCRGTGNSEQQQAHRQQRWRRRKT